ncbi:TauD/TfdA family dioxygenase [Streptomyces sp. URMC 127]|uniref:TauD/TfdA family dioxygenase n=1 Tax=Streptomyces sp. URMC 127 TaxID=3423402 RepID=UPI003F1B69DC
MGDDRTSSRPGSIKALKARKTTAPAPAPGTAAEAVRRRTVGDGPTRLVLFERTAPGIRLGDWARTRLDALEADLRTTGGIMFRGFGTDTPEELEDFASAFVPDLFNENGEHPRAAVNGNVYTPVFYPPEQRLLWHNENSFNDSGPGRIWFCCVRAAARGGETPVVDSRAVHDRLDPALRARFADKGVMYVRTYGTGLGLHWREVFRSDDKATVEQRCRASGLDFTWHGDRLHTRAVRPAVIRHPRTGRMSWFNQIQHWHTSCLDPQTRTALETVLDASELPRTCAYGDGTPIPDEVMAEILAVYQDLELALPWQPGDVMMLDNLSMAHGRNPFQGERKLLVAMGGMLDFG